MKFKIQGFSRAWASVSRWLKGSYWWFYKIWLASPGKETFFFNLFPSHPQVLSCKCDDFKLYGAWERGVTVRGLEPKAHVIHRDIFVMTPFSTLCMLNIVSETFKENFSFGLSLPYLVNFRASWLFSSHNICFLETSVSMKFNGLRNGWNANFTAIMSMF